jgi:hypothetical protein
VGRGGKEEVVVSAYTILNVYALLLRSTVTTETEGGLEGRYGQSGARRDERRWTCVSVCVHVCARACGGGGDIAARVVEDGLGEGGAGRRAEGVREGGPRARGSEREGKQWGRSGASQTLVGEASGGCRGLLRVPRVVAGGCGRGEREREREREKRRGGIVSGGVKRSFIRLDRGRLTTT